MNRTAALRLAAATLLATAVAAPTPPARAAGDEAEPVVLWPVRYRLVGEDANSPEKARMVAEQVASGARAAGRAVERGDGEAGPGLRVAVEESGALYEFTIELPLYERQARRLPPGDGSAD